jgi:hypothetical protein
LAKTCKSGFHRPVAPRSRIHERLRDAIEAFDLAERHEREIEADYDAWLLLLQQMKEVDAAQASNLGQVLAPAIAGRFEALIQKRYENVRLTAQLGTEGIVASGAVRSTERISVGTREQLSTLYRLIGGVPGEHGCS